MNTIRFICSEHGEQQFDHFGFARIQLTCGCSWRSTTSGLENVEYMGRHGGKPYGAEIWRSVT